MEKLESLEHLSKKKRVKKEPYQQRSRLLVEGSLSSKLQLEEEKLLLQACMATGLQKQEEGIFVVFFFLVGSVFRVGTTKSCSPCNGVWEWRVLEGKKMRGFLRG